METNPGLVEMYLLVVLTSNMYLLVALIQQITFFVYRQKAFFLNDVFRCAERDVHFVRDVRLRCMKNEAELRSMKRACGTRRRTGALRFISERSERLHGGSSAASLTSEASAFINRRQSETEGFLHKTV